MPKTPSSRRRGRRKVCAVGAHPGLCDAKPDASGKKIFSRDLFLPGRACRDRKTRAQSAMHASRNDARKRKRLEKSTIASLRVSHAATPTIRKRSIGVAKRTSVRSDGGGGGGKIFRRTVDT